MKSNIVTIVLVLLAAAAFYFLGKKNGAGQTKTDIVQNVALVKEIAQLAALEVNGVTNLKITNRGLATSVLDKLKNYLAENTLQVSVPFEAKYGVDKKKKKMDIDTKAGTVSIYLPPVKLMSMQLRLDKLETMSQSGVFNYTSIDEFVKAQKQLYAAALTSLETNNAYKRLAQDNISNTLAKYYLPLGYKVNCVFIEKSLGKQ